MHKIIFGPVVSRRFGISLGVDLSPSGKQCNFDCLYCELIGKKAQDQMQEILKLEDLVQSVQLALLEHPKIDVLTITANGEPTLYPFLYEFMSILKPMIPKNISTLILSNGSRFGVPSVQKALALFDIVKFSLDAADEDSFKRVDRPYRSINLKDLLAGIKDFSSKYQGELVAEILLVNNINDGAKNIEALVEFLKDIRVDRIDLGSVDRPPAYNVEAIGFDRLAQIAKQFEGMFVSLPHRKSSIPLIHQNYSREDLVEFISRRPVSVNESESLFDSQTLVVLKELYTDGILKIKKVANLEFYTTKS
ncbi:radical SAM protein [Helicobacter cappadocius]|uniref:Radical SAM protein n=1 Tax=Helicobacter cappadocius TaxID=3063998 RepID=A0AA90PRR5_9HELI|nr:MULTISPECIES: radical SAM protein [unclassified Helicobacter]MDO7252829.1 radical SAM protein [Helicobacter sp. faydin-H75]MDP2538872.1 radical SAM protein [Helicobacter sp. faydin-H76]